jgi:hypothetical protein
MLGSLRRVSVDKRSGEGRNLALLLQLLLHQLRVPSELHKNPAAASAATDTDYDDDGDDNDNDYYDV